MLLNTFYNIGMYKKDEKEKKPLYMIILVLHTTNEATEHRDENSKTFSFLAFYQNVALMV